MSTPVVVEFPHRFWFARYYNWKPVWFGSDEFGQHTICFSIPLIGSLVVVTRPCSGEGDCSDMAEFKCQFPACPYMGIGGCGPCYCITHDRELWTDWLAEGAGS